MVDSMVTPVEGRRALLKSWVSDRWYCSLSCYSGRRQPIVMLVSQIHSFSTVKRYITVKEVRLHSERGKATVTRVVGIVATVPCCDMGVTAPVMSWVRAPCIESLAPVWRSGVGARVLEGSGETVLTPEAKGVGRGGVCVRALGGRVRRNLRPRPSGSGEPRFGPEIEEADVPGPASWLLWMICFVFCVFLLL